MNEWDCVDLIITYTLTTHIQLVKPENTIVKEEKIRSTC